MPGPSVDFDLMRQKVGTLVARLLAVREALAQAGPAWRDVLRLLREMRGTRRRHAGEMGRQLDRLEAGIKKLAGTWDADGPALAALDAFLAEAASRGLGASGKERTRRILLVEDDPLTVRLISHFLKDEKVEVIPAADAEQALEQLDAVAPDLVLLDIILPGMDGFQFLERLKQPGRTFKAPVIVISSVSGEKEMLKALELGAVDFITKPFAPRIVTAKVMHYLNAG